MKKLKGVLQNTPSAAVIPLQPTIVIDSTEETWSEAYANWISGKNPTCDPAWKQGVYFH